MCYLYKYISKSTEHSLFIYLEMEKVTKPNIKLLATGKKLNVKQMQANAGELLPKHQANLESVLLVLDGECILKMEGKDHELKAGEPIIVPAGIKHQIKAKTNFKAAHIMPNDIEFEFFTD